MRAATTRVAGARAVVVAASAAAVAALAVVTALAPLVAVAAAALGVAVEGAWQTRRALRRAAAGPGAVVAGVASIPALALATTLWPALTLLAALVAGALLLAWHRPALGLGAAVLLFAFEGSVKIVLGLEESPLPAGNRATGAAALDLVLFGAITAVVLRDRLRTPRALWASATRAERVVIAIIGAWLVLSVLQVAQRGDLVAGAQGFRLFQAYTAVAVAALVVFAHRRLTPHATSALLGIGLIVSLYAAGRVLVGPADAEATFAREVPTVTMYGDTLRAIGSFSSAIGLMSFLTPLAVFALAAGLLMPRLRALAWSVGALSVVGLIGSYSRTSLFAVALGLCVALLLAFAGSGAGRRRVLVATALAVAALGAAYGGVLLASQTSPALRERAEGMLNPLGDRSTQLRFETWRRELRDAMDHPLGQGIGSVGAASSPDRARLRTTDNSFLKVLIEQGVLGLLLFGGGMLAAVLLLARRVRRTSGETRAVGISALSGFVAFLSISMVGESVEQPGKVLAWALLGAAAAHAFLAPRSPEPPGGGRRA